MSDQVGHVVIVVAIGLVYGFWEGCAITAAGTVLGEFCCFLAIGRLFMKRAQACVGFTHLRGPIGY